MCRARAAALRSTRAALADGALAGDRLRRRQQRRRRARRRAARARCGLRREGAARRAGRSVRGSARRKRAADCRAAGIRVHGRSRRARSATPTSSSTRCSAPVSRGRVGGDFRVGRRGDQCGERAGARARRAERARCRHRLAESRGRPRDGDRDVPRAEAGLVSRRRGGSLRRARVRRLELPPALGAGSAPPLKRLVFDDLRSRAAATAAQRAQRLVRPPLARRRRARNAGRDSPRGGGGAARRRRARLRRHASATASPACWQAGQKSFAIQRLQRTDLDNVLRIVDGVVVGPGLGQSAWAHGLWRRLLRDRVAAGGRRGRAQFARARAASRADAGC